MVNHKTFSLLHYHLVPYWKYSIPFIIKVLKARHIERMTLDILLNYIDDFTTKDQYSVELSLSRIFSFQHLIEETIAKIMANGYYPDINPQLQSPCQNQQIKAFLEFALEFSCYKLYYPIPGRQTSGSIETSPASPERQCPGVGHKI